MGPSHHDAGCDVLGSADDLCVALGVRLRERPGAHWMVEMHPETAAEFDRADFHIRFDPRLVQLYESRYVTRGEFRLSQRGFATGDSAVDARGAGGPVKGS